MNIMELLHSAWSWAKDHPALVWPIVTLIVTALLKRTPEQDAELSKNWPRLAAVLHLIGALGIDAPKVLEALGKVRTGKSEPPPKGPTILPAVLLACAIGLGTTACSQEAIDALRQSTAEKARCAIRNLNLPNETIITKCLLEGAPEDIARILALVGAAREEAASAALVAAAVQRDIDQKVGICIPEKAK